jgi:hypothetical protein
LYILIDFTLHKIKVLRKITIDFWGKCHVLWLSDIKRYLRHFWIFILYVTYLSFEYLFCNYESLFCLNNLFFVSSLIYFTNSYLIFYIIFIIILYSNFLYNIFYFVCFLLTLYQIFIISPHFAKSPF